MRVGGIVGKRLRGRTTSGLVVGGISLVVLASLAPQAVAVPSEVQVSSAREADSVGASADAAEAKRSGPAGRAGGRSK